MRTTDAHTVTVFSPGEVSSVAAAGRPAENSQSTTLQDRQTSSRNHRVLLERIVAGLRALHDTDPIGPSRTDLPIRNYAQPDQAAP
jgi:hypothetical protein